MKKRFMAFVLMSAMLFSVFGAYAFDSETAGAAAEAVAETELTDGNGGRMPEEAVLGNTETEEPKAEEPEDGGEIPDENSGAADENSDGLNAAENGEKTESDGNISGNAAETAAEITGIDEAEINTAELQEYTGGMPGYIDISLTKTQYLVGDSDTVIICSNAEKIPSDDEHLTYSSSNPEFFTVSADGVIEAAAVGNSVITVTYTGDGGETVSNGMLVFCTAKNTNPNNPNYVQLMQGSATDPAGIGSAQVYRGDGRPQLYTHPISKRMMQIWFYDDAKTNGNALGILIGRNSSNANVQMYLRRAGGAEGYYYLDIPNVTNTGNFSIENLKGSCKTENRKAGWHQFAALNITGIGGKTLRRVLIDGKVIAEFESSNIEMQAFCVQDTSMYSKKTYYVSNMSTAEPGTIVSTSFVYSQPEVNLPDKPIEITFSRDVDGEYIDDSWITLTEASNKDVRILCDLSADGSVLKAAQRYPLKNGTKYQITIGAGIRFAELANRPSFLAAESVKRFPTCEAELYAKDLKSTSDGSKLAAEATLVNNSSSERAVYMVMSVFDGEKTVEATAKKYVLKPNSGENTGCGITSGVTDIAGKTAEVYVWEKIGDGLGKTLCDSLSIGDTDRKTETAETAENSYVDIDMNQDTGLLTIKGFSAAERLGLPVVVGITNPTAGNPTETYDYKTATEENFSTVYYRTEQISTAADGTFGYSMPVTGISGNYGVVVILPYDGTVYGKAVSFVSESERGELIAAINTADKTNIAERFAAVAPKLGIYEQRFVNLKNKEYVYSYILGRNDYAATTEIKERYTEAMEKIVALETSDETTLKYLADNAELLNISGHTGYKYLLAAKPDVMKNMLAKIRMCGSDAEIKKLIEDKTAAVSLMHISNYSEVYGIISALNEYIGADIASYNALTSDSQGDVQRAFVDTVSDTTSNEDIRKLFDGKTTEYSAVVPNPGSGTGKGSGGGGGGGGVSSRTNKSTISGSLEQGTGDAPQYSLPQWVLDEKALEERVSFSDLDGAEWAKESINKLYNMNIINGYEDGRFGVNDNITREQLVKILVLAGGLTMPEDAANVSFADIGSSDWYAEYIAIAVANGVVNGQSDEYFGVGQFVTREDASAMIYRLSQAKNAFLDEDITIHPFNDTDEISEYARHAVEVLRESFIVNGLAGNIFAPKQNLTRAEAAKIVYGYLSYID